MSCRYIIIIKITGAAASTYSLVQADPTGIQVVGADPTGKQTLQAGLSYKQKLDKIPDSDIG